jgi:hypothetical protein
MRGSTLTIGVFCFKPVQQESVFINDSDGLIRGILLQSWQESFFYGVHVLHQFQQYFRYMYIMAVSFIGEGNWSTRRKH